MTADTRAVLGHACRQVGLDASTAELIRVGENTLYRLPAAVVARVTRAGQLEAARKEVRVSGWLSASGIPVVEALMDIEQPVEVGGRAVTFWRELPPHRRGTHAELADLLKRVHGLPLPAFNLPELQPFVRLRERLAEVNWLPKADLDFVGKRVHDLQEQWSRIRSGRGRRAIHGDAWVGNVAGIERGPVLLDLERFAYGDPEWDLVGVAVSHTTFGSMSAEAWAAFCERYGQDVTAWGGFELFRDIRELRKVTFAVQMAGQRPELAEQARYRLACLKGEHGPRPWGWTGMP